jgi:flagellar hook-basal body complex protein FliE
MSDMQIAQVLQQIRSLSAQLKPEGAGHPTAEAAGPSDFARLLQKGVSAVNETQQHAGALSEAFERGTPGVELPDVMLELQKASVSFRALTEVRNRLVTAYQDIMNMPL